MKLREIASIAQRHGIKVGRLNKASLIQAIQRAEGNLPCFTVGKAAECGQLACLWREDCA